MQAYNIIAPVAPNPGRDAAPKGNAAETDSATASAADGSDSFEDVVRQEEQRASHGAPDSKSDEPAPQKAEKAETPAADVTEDQAALHDVEPDQSDVDLDFIPKLTTEAEAGKTAETPRPVETAKPAEKLPTASTPGQALVAPVPSETGMLGGAAAAPAVPDITVRAAGESSAPATVAVTPEGAAVARNATSTRETGILTEQSARATDVRADAPTKDTPAQAETTAAKTATPERAATTTTTTAPVPPATATAALEGQPAAMTTPSGASDASQEARAVEALSPASESRAIEAARPQVARTDLPRPELARHVSQQIIDSVQRTREGTFEISLSPEELGRVRMTLTPTETGLHLNLSSERPETLDLLRRHIASLQQDFAALGYGDIAFDFGQSEGEAGTSGEMFGSTQGTDTDALRDGATQVPLQRLALDGGLDLRL